jgi:iron complex transport system substrate-binding protein
MRVVSVLPSATELVFALGHGSELVGRSEECDHPAEVRRLPAVMRPRTWDAGLASATIDARVQRVRAGGESLYTLDVPLLASLAPDLLLTQDLCGVCSATPDEVVAACRRAGVAPKIVALTPRTLADVWDGARVVGEALGDASAGEDLAHELAGRGGRTAVSGELRVAVVEWLDPPILAGLWTPRMVEVAGGRYLGPAEGEVGRRTTWPEIARLAPDLLILSPCSFSVPRTREELRERALGASVAAVQPPAGILVADEAYFSRPGPRLADGVELLAHALRREEWRPPMPVESWSPETAVA